jgi:uncharacterized RDD family membrane protein YckC
MTGAGGGLLWRKLAAGAIDAVLFLAVASLASTALYVASGGVVRAYAFAPVTRCEPMAEVPADVVRAAQAALSATAPTATAAVSCRRMFLGLETGRFISVSLQAQQGETVIGATVFQPVDRHGRPVQPMTLEWLYPVGLLLLFAVLEGRLGATPGKSAMDLRVVAAGGGPAGVGRALRRNLVLLSWLIAWALWRIALPHLAPRLAPTREALEALQAVGPAVVGLLGAAVAGMLLLGRGAPAYDRWAGVRVVRA